MPKLTRREGERIELERERTDAALADPAAFTSHRGGNLLSGIEDDGEVVGIPGGDEELRRVSSKVHDIPGITPSSARLFDQPAGIVESTRQRLQVEC